MQKAIDVVRPTCPQANQHHQLRKWVASLPSCAWQDDGYWYLIVKPTPHPCTWYIAKEDTLSQTQRGLRLLARCFYSLGATSITVCHKA